MREAERLRKAVAGLRAAIDLIDEHVAMDEATMEPIRRALRVAEGSETVPGRPVDVPGFGGRFEAVQRMVGGALRQTINDHGPIDRNWIGSASKRVAKTLLDSGQRPAWRVWGVTADDVVAACHVAIRRANAPLVWVHERADGPACWAIVEPEHLERLAGVESGEGDPLWLHHDHVEPGMW